MTSRMAYLSGLTDVDPDAGVEEEVAEPTPEQPRIELSGDEEQERWWQELLDRTLADIEAEQAKEESK